MSIIKDFLRRRLDAHGWFVRKSAGLPAGIQLARDYRTVAGLPDPSCIIDVGAHRGETALRFSELFPAARIISFEPVSANFAALRQTVAALPHVECHPFALGDVVQELTIRLHSDSQTHSLRDRESRDGPGCETIRVSTLDTFAAERRLTQIDLLKIDTEGYEIAVLTGASRQLQERRIRAILVEATVDPSDSDHTPLEAIVSKLAPHGFRLAAIYDQVIWREPTRLAYFNALFVRS